MAADRAARAWTFGLIADLQYADIPDGSGFAGTDKRRFRGSLDKARHASATFRQHFCACVVQLGDLIDGKALGSYDGYAPAGSASVEQRAAATEQLGAVLDALRGPGDASPPLFHLRGNHENYAFSLAEMHALLPLPRAPAALSYAPAHAMAYEFAPAAGWRFIVLDSYEVSMAAAAGSPKRAAAELALRANNPNLFPDPPCARDFFAGLAGAVRRFVPFNGACSDAQLAWLQQTLESARTAAERVIVCTHVPLLPVQTRRAHLPPVDPSEPSRFDCLHFNYERVLQLLAAFAASIALVVAGHDHEGAFGVDDAGIPHLTLPSPLVHDADSHTIVEVHADRLEVIGFGACESRTLPLREL